MNALIGLERAAPQPFLTLPFQRGTDVTVSQGWIYDEVERAIHPSIPKHFGVDFQADWGTPVLAPADGMALASYHVVYIAASDGRDIGFGLGLCVVTWCPGVEYYVCMAHLASLGEGIPYIAPEFDRDAETWQPRAALYVPVDKFISQAAPVKRGQVIGSVGHTGLLLRDETPSNPPITTMSDPSWDPAGPHAHVEVYRRTSDGSRKDKNQRFDLFGIYGHKEAYNLDVATGLLLGDKQGHPFWASDKLTE